MRIPGLGRVRRLIGRDSSAAGARTAVLMYHRVAAAEIDPWDLCVAPDHFEQQLEIVARRSVVTIDDLVGGRVPASSVVLTLDDGYCDTVDAMLPAIRRTGVPITVYVTTGGLDEVALCWWDRLAELVYQPAHLPDSSVPLIGAADVRTRDDVHLALWERLADADPHVQRTRLDEIAEWVGEESERVGGASQPLARLIDRAGVQQLAAEPLVTIGAHTVGHRLLPELDRDARLDEIVRSSDHLETLTGEAIRHFAYPHGRYDDVTVADVRELGFTSAVTTDAHLATAGSDLHRLPRVQVPDLEGDAFECWLDELFEPNGS